MISCNGRCVRPRSGIIDAQLDVLMPRRMFVHLVFGHEEADGSSTVGVCHQGPLYPASCWNGSAGQCNLCSSIRMNATKFARPADVSRSIQQALWLAKQDTRVCDEGNDRLVHCFAQVHGLCFTPLRHSDQHSAASISNRRRSVTTIEGSCWRTRRGTKHDYSRPPLHTACVSGHRMPYQSPFHCDAMSRQIATPADNSTGRRSSAHPRCMHSIKISSPWQQLLQSSLRIVGGSHFSRR